MTRRWVEKRLADLFDLRSGDFHATAELDPGNIPLISCGNRNNGLVDFFDIPPENTYRNAITVAYNGQPLTAKFHPYRFGAKDDVAVLIPRSPMRNSTLLYTAAFLDNMKWRYSYGRKCFRKKLENVRVSMPVLRANGVETIDEDAIDDIFSKDYREFIPERTASGPITIPRIQWRRFDLVELFDPARGDFHSIAALDPGPYMTVSRVSEDNGVVGYFLPPETARIYPRGVITISTVGGDAFVQLDDFIATDNVIVCVPKKPLRLPTLFFIAFALNWQKWRYSYGRQCYIKKVKQVNFHLPVTQEGELDEDSIEYIVKQTSYWPHVARRFTQQ